MWPVLLTHTCVPIPSNRPPLFNALAQVGQELAELQHEDERMSRSQAQEEKAGAPATPVSYMAKIASLRLQMQVGGCGCGGCNCSE
eukprot:scaffold226447_cov19-Tisochrysis_lutea.AAC.1